MKTSEAFKFARARLWNGRGEYPWNKSRYICTALDHLGSLQTARRCQRIISLLLDPTGKQAPDTLEDWLIKKGHLHEDYYLRRSVFDSPKIMRKVQATRKAWLDHLIEHYEAKGD